MGAMVPVEYCICKTCSSSARSIFHRWCAHPVVPEFLIRYHFLGLNLGDTLLHDIRVAGVAVTRCFIVQQLFLLGVLGIN